MNTPKSPHPNPHPIAPSHIAAHQQPARTAVLLCNLGTPDSPTAPAVRRYLAQFLSDPRVVEIPRLVWWPILHGIILRTRPAKSAAKYAKIWQPDGSPLQAITTRQAVQLQALLDQRGLRVTVRHAMRYGNPSIESQLQKLKNEGFNRILILPLYPQYSGTTTASVWDAVIAWGKQQRWIPELRFVHQFHDIEGYIAALAAQVQANWQRTGRNAQSSHLVMSFHGVPERTLHLGDPYHCHCHKTARLLANRLGLSADQYSVTFQSRFGKAKWLEPATEASLIALAQQGVKAVQVICPGFVADCLETLEEINMECREVFIHAGGEQFDYITCLNDQPDWMQSLADLTAKHLQGWPVK